MISTIAVVAPGAMGSAVGHRLSEHGAQVLTSLVGRSTATAQRAQAAHMMDADLDTIAQADIILSILPPAQALSFAKSLAPSLTRARRKALYVDCNAVNLQTIHEIAAIIQACGARFVDGGIIGLPPSPTNNPTLYFSGDAAPELSGLDQLGLRIQIMPAPIGAASALKMSYAGISKGVTLLSAAMLLGATRAGAADALYDELAHSQPQLLARLGRTIPDMYAKTQRWTPEMEEIAQFLGDDAAARQIYEGMAALCRRLAADQAGDAAQIALLNDFIAKLEKSG